MNTRVLVNQAERKQSTLENHVHALKTQNQCGLDLTQQMLDRQTDRHGEGDLVMRQGRVLFSKRHMILGQKLPISSWTNVETLFAFPLFGKVDMPVPINF